MAISLEELALGALEGSAGPWTLAVGAGALAVMLAAGSARPIRRMAASGVVTAQRQGQLPSTGSVSMSISSWLGSVRRSWRDLVAEARAEYEAGRQTAPLAIAAGTPVVLKPEDRAAPPDSAQAASTAEAATAGPPDHDRDAPMTTSPEHASPQAEAAAPDVADTTDPPARLVRDQRGRFVRRQSTAARNNGTRSE